MKTFSYKAINKSNQELIGSISAENIETVKEKLNILGLSIIELKESTQTFEQNEENTIFEFEAKDGQDKTINGTIEAKTEEEAYLRLRDEYDLNITKLYDSKAPKEKQKKIKIDELADRYEKLKKKSGEDDEVIVNEAQKQRFIQKINYTLDKVDNILAKFGNEIKPEEKKIIDNYIQEIIRYKESTNLPHLVNLCEKLLSTLQREDIFIQKGKNIGKKTDLKLQTQKLVALMREKDKPKKESPKIGEKLLNSLEKKQKALKSSKIQNFLKKLFPEKDIKIVELENKLKENRMQIFEYIKLYFQNRSHEYKDEILANIKKLYSNRKKIKSDLKTFKNKSKDMGQEIQFKPKNKFMIFLEDINTFLGWLTSFYLIFYFIAIFTITKDMGLKNIPSSFYIYNSKFFILIIALVFITYTGIKTKFLFLKHNLLANFIIFPIWFIVLVLILFNFT